MSAICPCDSPAVAAPLNLPGLPQIAYRVGTYAGFRGAVLTPLLDPVTGLPLERILSVGGKPVWRTDGAGDLAVMVAEWFAYIADILTFYNERIANEQYLGTAVLPDSVSNLIGLLGYRPRPAIGATGQLAALVSAGQITLLPRGLQFQSKPVPGQAPQIFELDAATWIGPPDQLQAVPPPALLSQTAASISVSHAAGAGKFRTQMRFPGGARYGDGAIASGVTWRPGSYGLLLRGAVRIDPGTLLALRPRDPASGPPLLATVSASTASPAQTSLTFSLSGRPPAGLTAAQASLEQPNQSTTLWSIFPGAISADGLTVHLASLSRQIHGGDYVLFSAGGGAVLCQVSGITETIWDATGAVATPTTPATDGHPVPIPHTVLRLASPVETSWRGAEGSVTVRFGWVPAGVLLDQPYGLWSGAPAALIAPPGSQQPGFPTGTLPILLQDVNGAGLATTGTSAGDTNLLLGTLQKRAPILQPPFTILPNVLPVSRGKTVKREILGSGDATNPAQKFKLAQSPVTYLENGAGWNSTIALTVNGLPWTEVKFFFGQAASAQVFVTSEDAAGNTYVAFGDGVNGARLPTGANNVVASYRVGGGAASAAAQKLTVIAQSYPGLRAILNPVAVSGGADPDPPALIRRYAPRSVLAFGRAVSVLDYQAIAAQAPGVTRAGVAWSWNDSRQRALVTIYVGDDAGALASARKVLAAAGDPNRPIQALAAVAVPVQLALTLAVTPGMDPAAIAANVVTALSDPQTGLFGAWNMGVGQPVFDSQVEAAVLAIAGAVSITSASFSVNGAADAGPLHNPGESGFYTLDHTAVALLTEPANGG